MGILPRDPDLDREQRSLRPSSVDKYLKRQVPQMSSMPRYSSSLVISFGKKALAMG